jgi:predicted nucleotidyltransferase
VSEEWLAGPVVETRRASMVRKPHNLCYDPLMERADAIATLKAHEAELKQLGVEYLFLFGSTARGEAREGSDVDLFFDHPEGSLGLFELMDVKAAATRILGRKADIVTRRSLHRVLRETIEASAQQVF